MQGNIRKTLTMHRLKRLFPIFIIFFIAIVLRSLYFIDVKDKPIFWTLASDAQIYNKWSIEIVNGSKTYQPELLSRGYSYFLAIIYRFVDEGHRLKAVALVQLFLGSLNCCLIYLIACRLTSSIGASFAGLLSIFYVISFFYECTISNVTLINFFNLLSIIGLLRGIEKRSVFSILLAGVFLGGSVLLRPNALLFGLVATLWIVFTTMQSTIRRKMIYATFFILGILAGYVPLSQFDSSHNVGKGALLSSAGINFYIGNNANSNGVFWQPQNFELRNVTHMISNFTNHASSLAGRTLNASETGPFLFLQALKFIFFHPLEWTKLIAKKLSLLSNSFEIPSNLWFEFYKDKALLLKWSWVDFGAIMSMGIIGFFITFFELRKINLLHLYFLTSVIAVVLFFVLSEYKYPLVPALQIFSAITIKWCMDKVYSKEFLKLIQLFICIVAGIFLTHVKVPSEITRPISTNNHFNVGLFYSSIGNYSDASLNFETAMREGLNSPIILNELGKTQLRGGKIEQSVKTFKKAIEDYPDFPESYFNLGKILYEQKEYNSALQLFLKTISLCSGSTEIYKNLVSEAYNNLGATYFKLRRYKEALVIFQKVVELDPESAKAYNNLGSAYYHLQEYDKAIRSFQRAIELKPDYITAQENLRNLHEQGSRNRGDINGLK